MASLNLKMVKLLLFCVLMPGYYKANGRCLRKSEKETCPAGWSNWKNHCYKVIGRLQWATAKDKCIEIGGWMATPNSLEEHSHFWNLASKEIWIDCNDIQTEGTWECKDGATDVDFRNWAYWEPNNERYNDGTVENCGKLWDSAWGDVPCHWLHPAVCKQSVTYTIQHTYRDQ